MRKAITTLAMAMASASGAVAAPVLFSGEGTITRSLGALPATGSAVVGDTVRFSFVFDLDDAAPLFTSPTFNAYALPFTDFSAGIGDYAFTPGSATAQLGIGRGFTFFGGNATEPSRSFSFSFRDVPGPDAPFSGATVEQFSISASFRDAAGPTTPVTLADVTDPAGAARRSFDYLGSAGGMPPVFSSLSGAYQGGFAAVAGAVPEPATWAMMIVGFGAVGGALRRRGRTTIAVTI